MTSKFLYHESNETGNPNNDDPNLSSDEPSDISVESVIDNESEDINAIAETQQRKFPVVALLLTCAIIIGLLAGVVYYAKNEMGSIGEKQTTPTTSPDPLLTAKPIQINEIPPHFASLDPNNPNAVSVSGSNMAIGVATPSGAQGPAGCPHVPVTDPLGNPIPDANGVPAMMDCHGRVVRSPEIVPAVQATTSPGVTPAAGKAGSPSPQTVPVVVPVDRYRGAVVLGKDDTLKPGPLPGSAVFASPTSAADAAIAAMQQQLAFPGAFNQPAMTSQSPIQPISSPPAPLRSGNQGRNVAVKSIDENLVIPKGHTADCALTMRAVTETNGFAECIITANVYSANGRTLLIERFSKAFGEYNVNSAAGQRVIPILWTSIRKPGGITIELSAPAVDGLGGAGLTATVDNRWGERIGGAYLLSIVKDVIAYKTAKDAAGAAGAQVYQNTTQASNDIIEKILSTTIGIKPTLYANQGDRALILFNRDVDFSEVYDVQRRK